MKKREFFYPSANGKSMIHGIEWIPDGCPCGILQIAHGVTEHAGRYEEFADFFVQNGYVVVANDHLGHGVSVAEGEVPMYFGGAGSFRYASEDLYRLMQDTKKRYPKVPYYMMGFSLGSFLLRTLLIDHPGACEKAILVGTGQQPAFFIKLARLIAVQEGKKHGDTSITKKIHDLTFGTYNKGFSPNQTPYDWLLVSKEAISAYVNDPLRGEGFSCGLFRELLSAMEYSGKVSNVQKMDKNMPLLLLSGADDPVGDRGKGVQKVCKILKKVGCKNVSMKLYEGLRHDILHEREGLDVCADILAWIKNDM